MVSNRTLALFIVATIIVSLGGTLLSLNKLQQLTEIQKVVGPKQITGYAGALGNLDLSIGTLVACTTLSNVSFGTGSGITGVFELSTNATSPFSFNDCTSADCLGITINNTGNVPVAVNMTSNSTPAQFVPRPATNASDFQFIVSNGSTAGAVAGCSSALQDQWADINTSENVICSRLRADLTGRTITVEFNVTIAEDTETGNHKATMTITCGQTA